MASCCNENMLDFKWVNLGKGRPPEKSKDDIGWDLRCVQNKDFRELYHGNLGNRDSELCYELAPGKRYVFSTHICIELPEGYHGILKPRSGLAVKKGIQVLAGVIDSGYRGEILVCLFNSGSETVHICDGDKICQMIIVKENEGVFREVKLVSETNRGSQGFGSTGR